MKAILGFFIRFAPFIYIILAIGLVTGIRKLALARREAREAIYGLEHEIAQHHINQAVTTLSLILTIAIAEFILIVFLQPLLPATFELSTPTNAILSPLSTLSLDGSGTASVETPVLTLEGSETGCIPGQIYIASPKTGDEIKGAIKILGDANIPNFGFYKYEFAPFGSDSWLAVEASRNLIQNGTLGQWDTSNVLPGDYNLRLVVSDNQGNQLPACVISVRIKAP
jgi:hypothetical protein